jgi:starch-binding outer membrane protein, SusD/RagB family
MQSINKLFTVLAIATFSIATSCKKELLNTLPNDRLSSDVFWRSETDAKLAVNAIYPLLDSTNIISWDGLTDIGHTNQFFTNDALVERGVYDATNPKVTGEWNYAYRGIAAANFFLDNVDKVPSTNAALINQLKGEAKTLRAYQYIKLAAFYGDVPLVTKTIGIDEGKKLTRTPVSQIWDFINKELTEAAAVLPTTYSGTEKGRATKGAALALAARANLFAGRYQQAADAAKKVMDLNVYSIYPQYAKLFHYVAENNAEVILDKQYIKDIFPNNIFAFLAPYSQRGSGTANWVVPTKKLVDMYPMSNGKLITDPSSGFNPSTPYENRDPRLRYSIFLPGDVLPDGKAFNPLPNSGTPDAIGSTFYATSTGFTIKKYINNEDYANINNSGINIILLRYAEVLLTYAEAKIELNQIDQSVYDAINLVRGRSDVNLPAISNLTQSELREVVRRERTLELAFEGLRLFDIRRWKIAEQVIPGPVQGLTYLNNGQLTTVEVQAFEKVFNRSRDYLWPIPQKEKELNPGLTQNSGW